MHPVLNNIRLPCSSSNPLLRSYFSLYGVRHIAELPLAITCKQACVTSVAIFTALGFPTVRLPCSSSNPLLRSYFSLYGVRHIAELPLAITCKQACVTSVAIFTALGFPTVRLPCSSSNPLLRSYFSLYGVRHIAELPLAITCKRACVIPTDNSYCMADY